MEGDCDDCGELDATDEYVEDVTRRSRSFAARFLIVLLIASFFLWY
jgi:hypothetical protein